MLQPVLISFTVELWDAVDLCRNGQSRAAWIDAWVRRHPQVRALGHNIPPRPTGGKGIAGQRKANRRKGLRKAKNQ